MIRQAIIFSAGLGTRLRPITDHIPKALVEIKGKPMLQWNIEKLITAGCRTIVVNVHHFPEMIRDFLAANHYFGITIHISDESGAILDTGGGLVHAAPLFDHSTPIVAHNVDVLCDLDMNELLQYHNERNGLATLAVRDRETQRYFLFDNDLCLAGWQNKANNDVILKTGKPRTQLMPLAFSGIHIIDPAIFPLISQKGKFSITDLYLRLAESHLIVGFKDDASCWVDVGKTEQLQQAREIWGRK
ncbi:MAG: nucleotidyltransferase family protein [Prolixibacteraceae bacterium]|nr:nucleotidyltransferase family protein [Prolixibacteraceae bacterium]